MTNQINASSTNAEKIALFRALFVIHERRERTANRLFHAMF